MPLMNGKGFLATRSRIHTMNTRLKVFIIFLLHCTFSPLSWFRCRSSTFHKNWSCVRAHFLGTSRKLLLLLSFPVPAFQRSDGEWIDSERWWRCLQRWRFRWGWWLAGGMGKWVELWLL